MSDRNTGIDTLRGFMMILIIFANMLCSYQSDSLSYFVGSVILYFGPSVFMFLSGMVAKFGVNCNNVKRLSFVAIIFICVYELIFCFINGCGIDLTTIPFQMWYLPAVLFMRFVVSRVDGKWLILPCIILTLGIPMILPHSVFGLYELVISMPYFFLGYFYTRYFKYFKHGLSALMLALCAMIFFTWLAYDRTFFTDEIVSDPIVRLCIIALSSSLCIGLAGITPRFRIPLLTTFGQNSIVLYLFHYFVVLLLPVLDYDLLHMGYSAIVACVIALLFGFNRTRRFFDKIVDRLYSNLKFRYTSLGVCIMLLAGYQLALL